MKVLLDTCVMFPTVMREMLLGVAGQGLFTPLWSDRILEEWARAARRLGPTGEMQARGEIALLGVRWPKACVQYPPSLESRLWLPDPADIHVLAAAIAGHADLIITQNAKDFPRNILAEEGLKRLASDEFLCQFFQTNPKAVIQVAENTRQEAERLSGEEWEIRALMKKARLPRLGKLLAAS